MSPRMIRLPEAMAAEIEAIQASRLDAPDFSTVTRELIADALARRAGRNASKPK
jgi:hypothetical protein